MNNLLPSTLKYHEKYDLKGSSYKRKAVGAELGKSSPTYKDLDFQERHTEVSFFTRVLGIVFLECESCCLQRFDKRLVSLGAK